MSLMRAFRRRKTSAAIVGRLLAGYGELEFLLAFCVGAADASRTARKPGHQIGAHRTYHEHQAIKDMFRERGETNRFKRAKKRMNKEFAGAGLSGRLHRDNERDASVPQNQEPLYALSLDAI